MVHSELFSNPKGNKCPLSPPPPLPQMKLSFLLTGASVGYALFLPIFLDIRVEAYWNRTNFYSWWIVHTLVDFIFVVHCTLLHGSHTHYAVRTYVYGIVLTRMRWF